jgi:hypothetical protein
MAQNKIFRRNGTYTAPITTILPPLAPQDTNYLTKFSRQRFIPNPHAASSNTSHKSTYKKSTCSAKKKKKKKKKKKSPKQAQYNSNHDKITTTGTARHEFLNKILSTALHSQPLSRQQQRSPRGQPQQRARNRNGCAGGINEVLAGPEMVFMRFLRGFIGKLMEKRSKRSKNGEN